MATFNEARKLVALCLERNIPVMLVGSPGIGKTDLVKSVAKELGYTLHVDLPVISEPTYFGGFPIDKDGFVSLLPLSKYKPLFETKDDTIFFMDDIGQAKKAVQAAAMQVALARRIGDYELSPKVRVLAATNRRQDAAGVNSILEPLKGRFFIIHMEVDIKEWTIWAIKNRIHPDIIAFLNFRPDYLNKFEPTPEIVNTPNPRNWARFSAIYEGLAEEEAEIAANGNVGEEATVEFMAFLKIAKSIPSIDELVRNPQRVNELNEASQKFAVATACIHHSDKDNIDSVIDVVLQLPTEYQLLYVSGIAEGRSDLLPHSKKISKLLDDLINISRQHV